MVCRTRTLFTEAEPIFCTSETRFSITKKRVGEVPAMFVQPRNKSLILKKRVFSQVSGETSVYDLIGKRVGRPRFLACEFIFAQAPNLDEAMYCSTMHFRMLRFSTDTHMSRIARVVIAGLPHHVTQSGNRREADRRVFHTLTSRLSSASTLNVQTSKTGQRPRFSHIHDLVYIFMNKWYL
jgi:hypothetical protein